MEEIFADTFYWVALTNPADQWHSLADTFVKENQIILVTSEEVLTEYLNYYCDFGPYWRRAVYKMTQDILSDPAISVVDQTTLSFHTGLELYKNREDKGYSLTDCISMNIMRERGISRVLTRDDHFRQEGFVSMF